MLLLQERPRTSQEIARHFEVSKRTVLRDMGALYEIGIPVLSREGAGGGYSLPEDYRITPLPLTTQEAYLLLLALSAVNKLSDVPFAAERASLSAKVRALLPQQQLRDVEQALAISAVVVPERTQRAPFLEALMNAAAERRWVRVIYQSAERLSTQHLLPLELSSRNGLWYCRAYSYEHDEERTYRVDRVQSVAPAEQEFQPEELRQQRAYDDPSHPQVIVKLTPQGALRVESEPDMGGLVQRNKDGSAELNFRCPPGELSYYARYFAGLGSDAEVIAPNQLRSMLAQLGAELVEKYRSLQR